MTPDVLLAFVLGVLVGGLIDNLLVRLVDGMTTRRRGGR